MSNKYRGESSITALGKSYTLRMGNSELARIEGALHVEGPQETFAAFAKGSRGNITKALSIALSKHHRMLPEREVDDIVDELGAPEVANALLDLVWMANNGETWAEHQAKESEKEAAAKDAPAEKGASADPQ